MRRVAVRTAVVVAMAALWACGGDDAAGAGDVQGADAGVGADGVVLTDVAAGTDAPTGGVDSGEADGAATQDGGADVDDGGIASDSVDGGADAVDGGPGAADGGADAADGGADATDGGADAADGGQDLDAAAPDATGVDATDAGDAQDAGDAAGDASGPSCVPPLCEDGDPCTTDACVDGACTHAPISCDDGDPCTADDCESGACTHVLTPVTCPTPCPDAMALVPVGDASACVDRWEASRADASATGTGINDDLPPTARPGVYPWTKLGQVAAGAACAAAGKRLCTFEELGAACGGPEELLYPWGSAYDATKCNGYASGLAKMAPTGSFAGCASAGGVYDLSGNVQEWTATVSDKGNTCVFGGDYFPGSLSAEENEDSESCDPALFQCIAYADPTVVYTNLGFRCCADPGGAQ